VCVSPHRFWPSSDLPEALKSRRCAAPEPRSGHILVRQSRELESAQRRERG
jgi:hypothetical protein